jgi:type VI protein secretion system component VasF
MRKGRKEMRTVKSLMAAVCALMALAFFATATPATAQEPHYLQALSDLRTARDYIQFDQGRFKGGRRHAVDEINKAIEEIKHAAWDDGKNTQFAPPAQGVTTGWAPLRQAAKWLHQAKGHVAEGVDTPQNAGLRDRAMLHVDEAQRTIYSLVQAGDQ